MYMFYLISNHSIVENFPLYELFTLSVLPFSTNLFVIFGMNQHYEVIFLRDSIFPSWEYQQKVQRQS